MRVLAQPSSSSSCERNWSAFDFIHSKKRNRLTPSRAADLVYVFANLRNLNKIQTVDYLEYNAPWFEDAEEYEVVEDDDDDDESPVHGKQCALSSSAGYGQGKGDHARYGLRSACMHFCGL